MTPNVKIMSPEDLCARREELLAEHRVTAAELREWAASYTLTDNLVGVLDELDEIEYLLGA